MNKTFFLIKPNAEVHSETYLLINIMDVSAPGHKHDRLH